MSKKKMLAMAVLSAVTSIGFVMSASAEEHMSTDVAPVVVEGSGIVNANDTYDGKVIRTGGDVQVVTAAEIEKKGYTNVIEAIKKIPGVDVQQAGYRGFEYGYGNYQDSMSINGNSRVLILLDGKRLTNEASSAGANSGNNNFSFSKAQIFNMIGIENVERIEVIKGASAVAYGTDCPGGVINIITKKGERNNTTLGAAYGSWGKQQYKLTNAGKQGKVGWLVAYDKDKRNDSKYVDHEYKKTRTYKGSSFDEDSVFGKFNYEIDKHQSVEATYMYKHTNDEYPIMAPDYSARGALLDAIANGVDTSSSNSYTMDRSNPQWNRYHRWWYVYGAGTFTKNTTRNFDVKYNFKDDDEIDSYVRVYNNENRYYMDRNRPTFANYTQLQRKEYTWAKEQSKGVNVRWGKKINENNTLYTGFDYSKNSLSENSYATRTPAGVYKDGAIRNLKRDVWDAFAQDKISFGKLTVTPGVRYNYYGKASYSVKNPTNAESATKVDQANNAGKYSHLTMGIFADYELSKDNSIYASWSQIYNAPYASNQVRALNTLKAEEGDAYNVGYTGKSGKSTYGINYALLLMQNTYAGLLTPRAGYPGEYTTSYTNLKARTASIGANYSYKFDDKWSARVGYSHAKNSYSRNADTATSATLEEMRHSLSYNNRYVANVDYEVGKFSTGFDFTWYTGMDTKFFSDNQFLIVDWRANYKLNKKTSIYAQINNLTNRAYETKAIAAEGVGALPMEGRNFLIGCNYSF